MKKTTRILSLVMALCLIVSLAPVSAFAAESALPAGSLLDQGLSLPEETTDAEDIPSQEEPSAPAEEETPAPEEPTDEEETPAVEETPVPEEETPAEEPADEEETPAEEEPAAAEEVTLDGYDIEADKEYRILHLDCGRKYFTKDWIVALVKEAAAAGFTHVQLAFGNDGLRFLLDDMTVTANDTTYSSESVTAGIKAGNEAYYDAGDVNELTQTEMDAIIAAAKAAGIEIIPLLNTPGHMDAILDAMVYVGISDPEYSGSDRTVDVTNTEALSFTKEFVYKYVDYFASRGCTEFNFGADEYANDIESSPQFSGLITAGGYDDFISYINDLSAYIVAKGMVPMAFNDGIYYNEKTSYGTIDDDIMVCYWSSGWWGYDVASASYLANKGFRMINTHGDYYFVLTSDGITNPTSTVLNFDNETFMGSTISDPAGSMFCIWCDDPSSATEAEVAAAVRITLRKMAAAMQGTTTYSTEVVSGGFNEDGTIAETRSWKTVSPEDDSSIQVSGWELTSVTAEKLEGDDVPTVEGADNVVAYDITPYVGDTAYTEKGTVSLTVPEGWERITGFYVENGAVVKVEGASADGYYTFEMPHFSVGGIAEIAYDVLIELSVGGTDTKTIDGVNLSGNTYIPDPDGIASVTVKGNSSVTEATYTTADTIESGAQYLITFGGTYIVTSTTSNGYNGSWTSSTGLLLTSSTANQEDYLWTVTASGDGYTFMNSDGKYLNVAAQNNSVTLSDTAVVLSVIDNGDAFVIHNNSYCLNNFGGSNVYASCWSGTGDSNAVITLKKYTPAVSASTEITFTGVAPGETYVTINNVVYKIIVHDNVDITIKYQTADGTVIKTETVSVADNATEYTVSNFNYNDKYYVVESTTLNITPATVTEYTVTVTETEEDLSAVVPLIIEYWITNAQITDSDTNLSYLEISALQDGVYSSNGVAVTSLLPDVLAREGRNTEFWKTVLLDVTSSNNSSSGTEEQTLYIGDDETTAQQQISHVRYWNGKWQVLVGAAWVDVDRTEVTVTKYTYSSTDGTTTRETHQLVAYYMETIDFTNESGATELHYNAADWGFKDGESWGYWIGSDTSFNSVSVQIVYEDGTTNPVTDEASDLIDKTLLYGYWTEGRGLGTMIFTSESGYHIYKVTAETGDMTYTNNSYSVTINGFEWDGNEETIWEGDLTESASIHNSARNPDYTEPYDNLTWNSSAYNENNAILIRVYVRAVVTEESDELYVHYMDATTFGVEKATEFYNYLLNVPENTTFNQGFAMVEDYPTIDNALVNNTVVNNVGHTEKVTANLAALSEIGAQYKFSDYKLIEVRFGQNEDGTTDYTNVYLYYEFNPLVRFVADFGLPITFTPTDLSEKLTGIGIESVEVTEDTVFGYGEVEVDGTSVVYTPTKVFTGFDTFTVLVKTESEVTGILDESANEIAFRVYIHPATTVYYEEDFIDVISGWTDEGTDMTTSQAASKVGSQANYGYDVAYNSTTDNYLLSTKGTTSKAAFTFTGTGADIYADCTNETGTVVIQVKNASGSTVKLIQVNTVVKNGSTASTTYGTAYDSSRIAAIRDLAHGTYTINFITNETVMLDGIRVHGTMSDTETNTNIYYADLEDSPVYYELRDYVLSAMDVNSLLESSVYGKPSEMAGQVYAQVTEGTVAVILGDSTVDNTTTAQDLLENGPKNELYLLAGQTLVFNVTTNRAMQIGLKAPQGTASYVVDASYGENGTISLSSTNANTDMFYDLNNKTSSDQTTEYTYLVTVTNNGENILSVTDLKICDDPNATFQPLTQEDIEQVLRDMGFTDGDDAEDEETEDQETEEPEVTVTPEPEEPEVTVTPEPEATPEPTPTPDTGKADVSQQYQQMTEAMTRVMNAVKNLLLNIRKLIYG